MKKLLSLILASLILSMSAAMVYADDAEEAAAEAEAVTTEEAAAEAEIMLISEETEEEAPAEEAEETAEPEELKILSEGDEGYLAAKIEGQVTVSIVTVGNDQNIDARRLLDHNENTGISYTSSPDSNPILNLAFELDEPTVVTSFAFSCSVDTAGAVAAFLYATNDPDTTEWTYISTETTEAGDGFYTCNSVEKFVRKFKYYRIMLVFTPINEETNEPDITAPAEFYLNEVELFKEAPIEKPEIKNNIPSFPIFNSTLTKTIG